MISPLKQINDFITDMESTKHQVFMAETNKDEEIKYVLHNRDRFIRVINYLDKILTQNHKNISLLDIGTSPLTFILKQRYPNLEITTLDKTNNLVKRCEELKIKFIRADLNKPKILPTDLKYDIILFLEVIEHLTAEHSEVINWIAKITKNDGICIIQTPNIYSFKTIILDIIGIKTWNMLSKVPTDCPEEFAHSKEYSLSQLTSLVKNCPGLEVLEASRPIYFDTLSSSIVYRKFILLSKILLSLHYAIALNIPILRRGMEVIFTKNDSIVPHFGLPPSPITSQIANAGAEEIIQNAQKYFNKPHIELAVLDAGSGWGEYTSALAKHFGSVVGVEPQKDACVYAVKKYSKQKNLTFYNSPIEEFNTKQKFDLIISLTVFEHIANKKAFYDKIFSLIKPNGIIYITAPNKYWIFEQHYGLPFLAWLPLPIANTYLKITKGINSYEDCSYAFGYQGMKNFFNQYKCSYSFVLPFNEDSAYFGLNNSNNLAIFVRKLGINLIRFNPIFWNISKGFIMIIKKKN